MHFLLGNVIVKGKGLFKELLAVGAQLLAVFIVGGEHLPRLVRQYRAAAVLAAVFFICRKGIGGTTVHALE